MQIRRLLAVAVTSVTMAVAGLVLTPSPANAQTTTQVQRCWETSWVQGWLTGIAGHCVFDGEVYWYDFDGGWGTGMGY